MRLRRLSLGLALAVLAGAGCATQPRGEPEDSAFWDHGELADWKAAGSPAAAAALVGTWQPTGPSAVKWPDLYRFRPDGTFVEGTYREVVDGSGTPFAQGAYRVCARPAGDGGEILLHIQLRQEMELRRCPLQRLEFTAHGDDLTLTFALGSPSTTKVTMPYTRIDRAAP